MSGVTISMLCCTAPVRRALLGTAGQVQVIQSRRFVGGSWMATEKGTCRLAYDACASF